MTADYLFRILESDTFRQIATAISGGDKWYPQQDLAYGHTAMQTGAMLAAGSATLVQWMSSGADLNPPDIFANLGQRRRVATANTKDVFANHGEDLAQSGR